MPNDPVHLIGLDSLLHPGPEKQRLALPSELDAWAKDQAARELARRIEIIQDCVSAGLIGLTENPGRMEIKERARGVWTRHYHRFGGELAFADFWRSAQQAGVLAEYGWKPAKEKGE